MGDDEIARVDQASVETNNAITALDTKLNDEVSQLETAQSSTNDAITTLDTKVDTEVARLDGSVDDIQHTLDIMANLRGYKSAAGLMDFFKVDGSFESVQQNKDLDGYYKIDFSGNGMKVFVVLFIAALIFSPVMMVYLALKYFGARQANNTKYAKVSIVSETEAEDR